MGAFGAHALAGVLSPRQAGVWDTAVLYHLLHAVALLVTATLCGPMPGRLLRLAGWAFVLGIVFFSGSLYVLALGGPRVIGPVTPLGGVSFLVGWLALAGSAVLQRDS